MNDELIPKECDFLKISVFFSKTLRKGAKMHLQVESLLPLWYSGGKFNLQLNKPGWMVAQKRESAVLFVSSAYCLQWFWQHDSEGNSNKVILLFLLS